MRIAYVTETWDPSVDGVVTRLRATLGELHERGHETLVVAPAPGRRARMSNGALSSIGAQASNGVVEIPAVGFSFVGGGKPLGLPMRRRVTELIADYEPDVVHVVNPFVLGTAGVRAARRTGLPLVASFHQDIAAVARHYKVGFLSSVIWAHVRRLHGSAALNLATSAAMADLLVAQGIGRVDLWPYGVDLERYHPRRRRPEARRALLGGDAPGVVALYVGRLAPEKEVERLAPLARTPGVSLVIVGDGPLRQSLEAQLAGPNVHFTGWLAGDELADAYAGADVFVFPGTTETLGLVLIEALASGLPVIASDSAPSAEILGDDSGSELLDGPGWANLGSVVADVGAPGPDWQRRSAAARSRAKEWGWGTATDFLVDRYREVVSGSDGSLADGSPADRSPADRPRADGPPSAAPDRAAS